MALKLPDLNKPGFSIIPGTKARINNMKCPTCNGDIVEEDFKDNRSKVEYSISGMCQKCQDSVFG